MVLKNLLAFLSLGFLLFPFPAWSVQYSDHPYRLPFGSHSYQLSDGFASNSASLEAMEYYSDLAFSDKLTSKGYPYRACGYYFEFYAEIDLYPSDRLHHPDWDLGGRSDKKYYYNSRRFSDTYTSISVSTSSTNYNSTSRGKLSMYSTLNEMKESLINQLRDYQIFIQRGESYTFFYSSNATVKTKLRDSDYYKLGCNQAPVDNPPSCPNVSIISLPFVRGTVTCNQ
ncbi:MAG: hypothetical protein QNJ42_18680 [Crocosphaera sp.]|nr:hypothetical protein [Crocosphaera sp.]